MSTQIQITPSSANFANTDLTFTGTRTHDTAGNALNVFVDTTDYDKGFFDVGPLGSTFGYNQTFHSYGSLGLQTYVNGTAIATANSTGITIGAAPTTTARLDVRAQGALSTDIAFRVRNSGDTANIFQINGNRSAIFNLNNTVVKYFPSGDGAPNNYVDIGLATASYPSIKINATHGGSNFAYFEMNANSLNYFRHNSLLRFQDNASPNRTSIVLQASGGNVGIGTGAFGTSAINTFTMINGTAPSTSPADQFQLYSADIVAGNAAPHFRTENGSIIKLYQQSSAGITTVADLVTVLTNLGLLA